MTLNPAQRAAGQQPHAVCGCGCATRPRRYPSDTTDAEWEILEPLLAPPACRRRTGGRPEKHHRRAIVDAIFYLVDNGIKWRAMPADFPPWRTVYGFLTRWHDDLTALSLTDRLREQIRCAAGRTATPTAGCVDSQSVHECAEATVSRDTSGYDPHKRVNGRKRHIIVDTLGLLIAAHVTAANVQDRDGARPIVHQAALHGVGHIWADHGYHGDLITWANDLGVTIEIVPRPTGKGFQVLPRRWVVERTFAWLTRRRRCARDYERLPEHHETVIYWAAILQMTRRHARTRTTSPAT
ncbi:IS5 family transposase [Micromonospora echinaurantiaca]|uniref:IS5 family transposase n=1 Tax=Micromonospora echinaurantiaca TaxID=47857 RepID=UPI003719A894